MSQRERVRMSCMLDAEQLATYLSSWTGTDGPSSGGEIGQLL